tara:strand:- start:1557 stop:1799 length:243 start_codon:yes stop_codon:yes gene_type:complete
LIDLRSPEEPQQQLKGALKKRPKIDYGSSKPLLKRKPFKKENMSLEEKKELNKKNTQIELENKETISAWEKRTGKKWDEE